MKQKMTMLDTAEENPLKFSLKVRIRLFLTQINLGRVNICYLSYFFSLSPSKAVAIK